MSSAIGDISQRAVLCTVCEKVGRVNGQSGKMPTGWRRLTISNPVNLRKRGVTGYVCSSRCGRAFVDLEWNNPGTHLGRVAA